MAYDSPIEELLGLNGKSMKILKVLGIFLTNKTIKKQLKIRHFLVASFTLKNIIYFPVIYKYIDIRNLMSVLR